MRFWSGTLPTCIQTIQHNVQLVYSEKEMNDKNINLHDILSFRQISLVSFADSRAQGQINRKIIHI